MGHHASDTGVSSVHPADPPPPGRPADSSPLALRNWRVTWRLIALIVIPTTLGLVFGALRVVASNDGASGFGQVRSLAALDQQVTGLTQALEDERDRMAGFVAAGRPAAGLPDVRRQFTVTDGWAAEVRRLSAGIGAGYPAQAQDKLSAALVKLTQLPGLRVTAEDGGAGVLPVVLGYSATIDDLLSFGDEVAQGSANSALADTVHALSSLSRMKAEASAQRAILYASLLDGQFMLDSQTQLTNAQADQSSDLVQFDASATPVQQQQLTSAVAVTTAYQDQDQVVEQLALDTGGLPKVLGVSAAQWYTTTSATIGRMRAVEEQFAASVVAQSQVLQQGAAGSALITAILSLTLLLIAGSGTFVVARSLVGPLRVLRSDALDIASVRLPEKVRELELAEAPMAGMDVAPVSVRSTDEIGDVARAFDQVHSEAVRLAANQAMLRKNMNAMFVSLSRRSQSLLDRLMRLVDSLEQSEDNPGRLSSLFSMDHLVTRMRRHSHNLLVLAGHEPARTRTAAVALTEVVRAAASEISEYNRVIPDVQPGVAIAGQAVDDVIHLLAEIIENATSFSPKDCRVRVSGHVLDGGGVLLEVTDSGVGISAERLAQMNWRLDYPPDVDVSVSRHMGLFAVSHLAARHGVRIRLRPAHPAGLTAAVWIPGTLVAVASGGAAGWPAAQGARPPVTAGLGGAGAVARSPEPAPIYDSMASEWFSRGHEMARGAIGESPPAAADTRWRADAGWQAAESAVRPAHGPRTAAGLPQRIPRANMVPGAAASERRPPAAPQRSADEVRSLLAGLQRGTRKAKGTDGSRDRRPTDR
jgi:signal transduction histidine kinase